jgi:hypothetical protein
MRGAGVCGRDPISNSVLIGTWTDEMPIGITNFHAKIRPEMSQTVEEALTATQFVP